MENWGLITSKDALLLLDKETASIAQKQKIQYVIGHGAAHQWFGNLVTMEW